MLEHFEMDEDEKYKKQLEIYFETHQRSKIDGDKRTIQYVFYPTDIKTVFDNVVVSFINNLCDCPT